MSPTSRNTLDRRIIYDILFIGASFMTYYSSLGNLVRRLYGLYSYGIYSHAIYSHGIYSYGLYRYGLYSYGLYRWGTRYEIYMVYIIMAYIGVVYIVMAYIVMAYIVGEPDTTSTWPTHPPTNNRNVWP